MNYVQPQNANAPMPQQVNQPQQGYAPMPQPQQVNQPQQGYAPMPQPQQMNQPQVQQPQVQPQQAQGYEFYGANISEKDLSIVSQVYQAANSGLGVQLSDDTTVYKSLYFGARDLFKTIYVNLISSQRGSKPTTPDYELASSVFEQTFGTLAQPKVNQMQLCLAMKTFAPNMLPDCVPGDRPHEFILNYILNQNWHSQNVRNNSSINRSDNNNSNNNTTSPTYPFANNGGAQSQSKAAATAASGFVPQSQAVYNAQSAAQNLAGAMPNYQ